MRRCTYIRAVGCGALSLVWAACVGGQSGTEGDGSLGEIVSTGMRDFPPECCLPADDSVALRGELLELGPCELRARVTQVLDAAGRPAPEPGSVIAARPLSCLSPDAARPVPGDDLLLIFAPAAAAASAQVAYAPYGEPVQLAGAASDAHLLSGDVSLLLDAQACGEWLAEHAPSSQAAGAASGAGAGSALLSGGGGRGGAEPGDGSLAPIDSGPIPSEPVDGSAGSAAASGELAPPELEQAADQSVEASGFEPPIDPDDVQCPDEASGAAAELDPDG